MTRVSTVIRNITAAQRGQIIQRVMVDGWSPAQAAAVYGVAERHVARWVGAYRRYGMASLRDEGAAKGPRWRWSSGFRALAARIAAALCGDPKPHSAHCIELRRGGGRDPKPDPGRRSLWN